MASCGLGASATSNTHSVIIKSVSTCHRLSSSLSCSSWPLQVGITIFDFHISFLFFLGGVILFDNPKVMVGQRDLMRSSIPRLPSGDLVYIKARAIFEHRVRLGQIVRDKKPKRYYLFFLPLFVCFFLRRSLRDFLIFFDRSLMDFCEIDWNKLCHPEEILCNSFDIFSLPLLIRYFFFSLFFVLPLFLIVVFFIWKTMIERVTK